MVFLGRDYALCGVPAKGLRDFECGAGVKGDGMVQAMILHYWK